MKHLLPLLLLIPALFLGPGVHAQRIAFVNTKYILENMPEYQSAQQELNRWSSQWQDEIDERYEQIKRMRDAYNAEAILLTEEMKRSRLDEIQRREQEARELQKKRFGVEGDLFKKRQELIQPIQDRIYDAIKEVAGTSYVAIFDIGGQSNSILFASEKYDKSDSVLRKLGIRPGRGGGSDDDGRDDGGGDEEPDMGGRDTGGNDTQRQPPSRGGTDNVKPR
ncbi:MAG: OmpH family outer membrane protein [Flavobacteriales bacterium]|nr:OmpH family outer membrane protein [Flavobacteriales bacterium]